MPHYLLLSMSSNEIFNPFSTRYASKTKDMNRKYSYRLAAYSAGVTSNLAQDAEHLSSRTELQKCNSINSEGSFDRDGTRYGFSRALFISTSSFAWLL